MYKWLLCWKYLRSRYIALASIVSVMLGVATMIVVNAVMAGFSTTMQERLHGTLSDVVVESFSIDGFWNDDEVMAAIQEIAAPQIEAMAPTYQMFGLLQVPVGRELLTREVQIIGIRPDERAKVGDFEQYLFHQKQGSQALDTPAQPTLDVPEHLKARSVPGQLLSEADEDDPFRDALEADADFAVPDYGMILGYALATLHNSDTNTDIYLAPEGTKAILTFPTAGSTPKAMQGDFTVVSYFKSGMSEYDSSQVFVPLERLQYLRGQMKGDEGGAVNQIQIRAKPGVDLDLLAQKINVTLSRRWPSRFLVSTWEQKQGPLLAAVATEQNILNLLLFFIIAVAGFGILGIFSMIVVEKTRDIGILKALGASDTGVRGIFLAYGLSLGLVGSGVGMLGGLVFVDNINWIEDKLSELTGHEVFDDAIYYFPSIPTLVEPWTVAWIVMGALFIAVAASVWPAQRAAKMNPVRALRFE
jgi:lipoprotein-releasing system permease protein